MPLHLYRYSHHFRFFNPSYTLTHLQLTHLNPKKYYESNLTMYRNNSFPPRGDEEYRRWMTAGIDEWRGRGLPDTPLNNYVKRRMEVFYNHEINYIHARKIAEKESEDQTGGRPHVPDLEYQLPETLSGWGNARMKELLFLGITPLVAEKLVEIEEKKIGKRPEETPLSSGSRSQETHPNQNDNGEYKISKRDMQEFERRHQDLLEVGVSQADAAKLMDRDIFKSLKENGKIPNEYIPISPSNSSRRPAGEGPRPPSAGRYSSSRSYGRPEPTRFASAREQDPLYGGPPYNGPPRRGSSHIPTGAGPRPPFPETYSSSRNYDYCEFSSFASSWDQIPLYGGLPRRTYTSGNVGESDRDYFYRRMNEVRAAGWLFEDAQDIVQDELAARGSSGYSYRRGRYDDRYGSSTHEQYEGYW